MPSCPILPSIHVQHMKSPNHDTGSPAPLVEVEDSLPLVSGLVKRLTRNLGHVAGVMTIPLPACIESNIIMLARSQYLGKNSVVEAIFTVELKYQSIITISRHDDITSFSYWKGWTSAFLPLLLSPPMAILDLYCRGLMLSF